MVYRNEISYQEIEYFDPYGSTTPGIVVGPYVFVDSHLPIDSTVVCDSSNDSNLFCPNLINNFFIRGKVTGLKYDFS